MSAIQEKASKLQEYSKREDILHENPESGLKHLRLQLLFKELTSFGVPFESW